MAEASATPPIDLAAFKKELLGEFKGLVSGLVADAIKPLADNQKVFADTLAALPPAAKKDEGKSEPLTVEKLKADLLGEVKNLLTTHQQSASQQQARTSHIAAKLKDLPAVYQNQLGSDSSKWAAEEQSIREQFKSDLKVAGVKAPEISGDAPAGAIKPGAVVDISKLKGVELIDLAVQQSTPQQRTAAPAATATEAAAK